MGFKRLLMLGMLGTVLFFNSCGPVKNHAPEEKESIRAKKELVHQSDMSSLDIYLTEVAKTPIIGPRGMGAVGGTVQEVYIKNNQKLFAAKLLEISKENKEQQKQLDRIEQQNKQILELLGQNQNITQAPQMPTHIQH
ncbi:MAG: hypothetical protein FWE47_04115 [Oscillospiraceae bacterium]|nr:hypothetical protein [Oscillospiraceae bacterium]